MHRILFIYNFVLIICLEKIFSQILRFNFEFFMFNINSQKAKTQQVLTGGWDIRFDGSMLTSGEKYARRRLRLGRRSDSNVGYDFGP